MKPREEIAAHGREAVEKARKSGMALWDAREEMIRAFDETAEEGAK